MFDYIHYTILGYKLYNYYYNISNVLWIFNSTYTGYKWLVVKNNEPINEPLNEDWVLVDTYGDELVYV